MAEVRRAIVAAALLFMGVLVVLVLTGVPSFPLSLLLALLTGTALLVAGVLLLGRRSGKNPLRDLQSRDPDVRYLAARALGESGDPAAIGPLEKVLADEETGVRWAALEALGAIGTPALPVLIGLLDSRDVDLRWGAAVTLGEVGDPAAVGPLGAALADPDRYVRTRAALALAVIGGPSCAVLTSAVASPDPEVRWAAALALGRIASPACVPALCSLLADPDPQVRWKAAEGLGAIGNEEAVFALIPLLADPDPGVKAGAVDALAGTGSEAAGMVVEGLKMRDRWFGAVDTLREMGAAARPALHAALDWENPWVRIGAAMVLAEEGDEAGTAALFAALDDPDPDVRDAARQTLSAGLRRENEGGSDRGVI
ncbi:HEAT repeat protein [Methanofollis sp. W23]|uniref:HEAT repeat domain-containing protein n=1 Tax=Methanofollis sp. W23 TaxID=2817849 RepID=UPI001AE771F0|nr:HEAT repeat domain-containing protein [Methanofollis sp. W23]MBP2146690.1 HEAT repeat protein [Methanofollis sp. W23]